MDKKERKKLCESHMYRYVQVKMADGSSYDGIVEHVDDHWLCLAVPGAVEHHTRAFFAWPFPVGFGPWGYGVFYPFPRRFRRLVLPLAALLALSLLPYYW